MVPFPARRLARCLRGIRACGRNTRVFVLFHGLLVVQRSSTCAHWDKLGANDPPAPISTY
ncbi:hypothetical protein SBV1_1530020 [Verrucomicrobia bacterium]|nr:hypothetical protein SBV1_1530020 [Verrucomicrobiota bacterium]